MITLNWTDYICNCAGNDEIAARFVKACQDNKLLSDWAVMGPSFDEDTDRLCWVCFCGERDYCFTHEIPAIDFVGNRDKVMKHMEKMAEEIRANESQWNILEAINITKEEWEAKVAKAEENQGVRLDGEGINNKLKIEKHLDEWHEEKKSTLILPE
jgi:hypothetical protein